ncbi:MAG: DUF3347 domain-containing protein [Ekhidna sp.]|uniref:DUF3347 domain-containing protein n=1 Tax=Ekhidna sp. TaxID=2608089 RepID=UPI0032EB24C3
MKTTLLTLGLALAIASCSSAKKEEKAETKEAAKTEVTEASSGISDYMALKDALVQTDASAAKDAAAKLAESATKENWSADIVEATKTIASSDNVEAQRTAFKTVTDGLIASLKANDSEDGVYVQYCPMAFDNTGASWLSMSDQIRNPYFGDKMLKCGKVTEEL